MIALIQIINLLLSQTIDSLILIQQKSLTHTKSLIPRIIERSKLSTIIFLGKQCLSLLVKERNPSGLHIEINAYSIAFQGNGFPFLLGRYRHAFRAFNHRKAFLCKATSFGRLHHTYNFRADELDFNLHSLRSTRYSLLSLPESLSLDRQGR